MRGNLPRLICVPIMAVSLSAQAYEMPPFPELPSNSRYVDDTHLLVMTSQEDLFNRRDVFEEWQTDYRTAVTNSVYLADEAEVMRQLGAAVVRYQLDRAEWRRTRNELTGAIRKGHSEILLKQEQIKIMGMRAKVGEKIPVSDLANVQLEARVTGVEVAKIRLQRAELDVGFYERRFNEINSLGSNSIYSRDEIWDQLMNLNSAKQHVDGARKSLALAEMALDVARRQVENSKK